MVLTVDCADVCVCAPKCTGNVELTLHHLHSHFGENGSSFIISLWNSHRRLPEAITPPLIALSYTQLAIFCCLYLVFLWLFSDMSLLVLAAPSSWLFVKVKSESEVNPTRERFARYIRDRDERGKVKTLTLSQARTWLLL